MHLIGFKTFDMPNVVDLYYIYSIRTTTICFIKWESKCRGSYEFIFQKVIEEIGGGIFIRFFQNDFIVFLFHEKIQFRRCGFTLLFLFNFLLNSPELPPS